MDAQLQARLKSDTFFKKLILENGNIAGDAGLFDEWEILRRFREAGVISYGSAPKNREDFECLQSTVGTLNFETAKKISLALLQLAEVLEGESVVRMGLIDPACIFYAKDEPERICICQAHNFQIGALLPTWDLTVSDEEEYLSFQPLDEEKSLRSHIAMAVRTLEARSNIIGSLDSYSEILVSAGDIFDLMYRVEQLEDFISADKAVKTAGRGAEKGIPSELDVIYCIIPAENGLSESLEKLYGKILSVKCEVAREYAPKAKVYESFILPMSGDRMLITESAPFAPERMVDIFTVGTEMVSRGKMAAAAAVSKKKDPRPTYLYVIADSMYTGNTVGAKSSAARSDLKLLEGTGSGRFILRVVNGKNEEVHALSNDAIAQCCLSFGL